MEFTLHRTLRTPHSERYLLQAQGKDVAALELHYLIKGKVDGTLIIFEGAGMSEADAPETLHKIDAMLLPDVSIEAHNLSFTVVMGKVLGAFLPDERKT